MINGLRSKIKREKERTGIEKILKELSHERLTNENEVMKEKHSPTIHTSHNNMYFECNPYKLNLNPRQVMLTISSRYTSSVSVSSESKSLSTTPLFTTCQKTPDCTYDATTVYA